MLASIFICVVSLKCTKRTRKIYVINSAQHESGQAGCERASRRSDLIANNISNVSTTGFKLPDQEFYNLCFASSTPVQSTMPTIERAWTDFVSGACLTIPATRSTSRFGEGLPHGGFAARDVVHQERIAGSSTLQEFWKRPKAILSPRRYADGDHSGAARRQARAPANPRRTAPSPRTDRRSERHQPRRGLAESGEARKAKRAYFRMADSSARSARRAWPWRFCKGSLEASNSSPGRDRQADGGCVLVAIRDVAVYASSIGADMNKKAVEDVARVSG